MGLLEDLQAEAAKKRAEQPKNMHQETIDRHAGSEVNTNHIDPNYDGKKSFEQGLRKALGDE